MVDGQLSAMAPPGFKHQRLVMELSATIRNYVKNHRGAALFRGRCA
ncbi:MAG: Uma2 family endonuclease [Clostridiaceae bacterium]|nr:Uma2 family endonuclease [Clostridiaceae bacterium]